MFDTKRFGAYLAKLRKDADMTQSELAIKLNLTRQAISKYEVGDSFPDVSTLISITEIFDITIDELINSGTPSCGEVKIFKNVLNDSDSDLEFNMSDMINIAPLLKPSVLDRLAKT